MPQGRHGRSGNKSSPCAFRQGTAVEDIEVPGAPEEIAESPAVTPQPCSKDDEDTDGLGSDSMAPRQRGSKVAPSACASRRRLIADGGDGPAAPVGRFGSGSSSAYGAPESFATARNSTTCLYSRRRRFKSALATLLALAPPMTTPPGRLRILQASLWSASAASAVSGAGTTSPVVGSGFSAVL